MIYRRKSFIKEIIISLLLALLCFSNDVSAEVINVGVSAPLSGDLAEYGNAVKNGLLLAKEEEAERASNFNFIYEDNLYDAKTALSGFEKLYKIDQVDIVYLWGEAPYSSVASIAERQKIPVVVMSIDTKPAVGKKYSIRSVNPPADYAGPTLEYLYKDNALKLGIIKAEDPFFDAMAEAVEVKLQADQKIIFEESVSINEKDFRSLIIRLKKHKVDAIGVYLLSGQAGLFLSQAGKLGFKPKVFGTDVFESPEEVKHAQGFLEDAVYTNQKVPEKFIRKYSNRFDNVTQIAFAYNSYLFAKVVFDAPRDLDWKNADFVMSYLKGQKGANGVFEYTNDSEVGQYFKSPLVLRKVTKDGFKDIY